MPSSCGKVALQSIASFLRQQCNKLKPRVLVIEICSITGSAMMEAGDIADATIDVANVDYKKGIMTPDGTRRPWRRVGCIREVCFEKLIDECEATMGKGASYDAVFFLVTTSCQSFSAVSKHIHEAGEQSAKEKGDARSGCQGRVRRHERKVHRWVTLQMSRNYARTFHWLCSEAPAHAS